MPELLKGKVCLVTGAARGIGKAIASQFAEEGAVVYANERKEGTVAFWKGTLPPETAGSILPSCFDVTDVNSIKACVMKIRKEHGHLDVLVNNAGVEYNELIGMILDGHLRDMVDVNIIGTINMVQYCSKIMAKSEHASIINIASMVGVSGNPGQSAYAATKGAVIAFTKSAAKELGSRGICVNAIAPGLTRTEMFDKADPEKIKKRVDNIALGRIAEPEDISSACVFLASDLSRYVSGQIIGVDGCAVI